MTISKKEFEKKYAKQSGFPVEYLYQIGGSAILCDCGDAGCVGWKIVFPQTAKTCCNPFNPDDITVTIDDGGGVRAGIERENMNKADKKIVSGKPLGPSPAGGFAAIVDFLAGNETCRTCHFTYSKGEGCPHCMPWKNHRDAKTPTGFSETKGDPNYFQAAINQCWEELGIDTDTEEIRWILNWFDKKREELKGRT